MFLLLLIILFSVASVFIMSYLAMNTQIGPWVAPLLIVMNTMIAIPFVSRRLFSKYATVMIATCSLGGMIGICLGMTVPSFYFLQQKEFLILLGSPVKFSVLISMFVLFAGLLAFVISYLIKDHLILEKKLPFPMVQLIYDIVSIEPKATISSGHRGMLSGVGIVSMWNLITMSLKTMLSSYNLEMQVVPFMVSVGFVAGRLILVPVCIGLVTRIVLLRFLQDRFFSNMITQDFLITFACGMLLVFFVKSFWGVLQIVKNKKISLPHSIKILTRDGKFLVMSSVIIAGCVLWLHFCGVDWRVLLYVIPLLFGVCFGVAKILGEIGVVELDSFVWFIILPLIYGVIHVSSLSVLFVSLFSMLCLGMVIDLIFAYKLAHLANIEYRRIFHYQLLGLGVASLVSGLIMWLYFYMFGLNLGQLVAPKAQELDNLIQFGAYNYKVLICGIVWSCIFQLVCKEILAVIGATLMAPTISIWLMVASASSYVIKKPERLYPLCFGVYAGHVCWIIVRSVF